MLEHPSLWHSESPEQLAVRAQGGSVQAYSVLVARFQERLFNFLLRRVKTSADAEDLTQEAFVRAWQRIATYSPQWKFSTWLFTIAIRLAVSESRRPQRPMERLGDVPVSVPALSGSRLVAREERGRIWALVGEVLSVDQQAAVWLRYVEDMAITDIARVMGRSQVAVRVMLFRARALLAARMRPEAEESQKSRAGAAAAGIKG
jgi:RNA polymerase sigma-70 factor (ECF subfamily)